MTGRNEAIKSIIRIEKETYDLYRLLDESHLDEKVRNALKRCAMEASKNLQMLEKKYWELDPSLATYLQHFVPEFELDISDCDECAILENLFENRKSLCSLYSNLSQLNEDPELRNMYHEMAERAEPLIVD